MVVDLVVEVDLRVMVVPGNSGHPTILIVQEDGEFRAVLTRILEEKGYLVLETQNTLKALVIAIRHSRSIHLLLADDSDDSRDLAATLKPYRPDMNVIHISPNLELDLILMEVSKILEPPVQHSRTTSLQGLT
jgi:CheY-like chemotaxis protein